MKPNFCLSVSIAAPPRASPIAAAIVLVIVGLLTAAMAQPLAAHPWLIVALTALVFWAVILKAVYAIHMGLFALMWLIWTGFFPRFQWWPFHLLVPLVVYGAAVVFLAPLRRSVGWLRAGGMGTKIWIMVAATGILSAAALMLWAVGAKPDLSGHLSMMPKMPFFIYPLAAIGFACLNAAMEEVIFRGIMLEALDSALGESFWAVCLQAASFAVLHYPSGFPNGLMGVLMVSVYGLMLGAVRRRARGLLASFIAHVAADLTIFFTLLTILVRN